MERRNLDFKIFVTEPLPEIDYGLELVKDARIEVKKEFSSYVSYEDVKDCDAIVAGDSKITCNIIRKTTRLRVICRFGAGLDSVDVNACTEKGIIVTNLPGMNAQSVAEHTIGMIVAVMKKFVILDGLVRSGGWERKARYVGRELHGKTLGIVGMGNIGTQVARIAEAFGMRVIIYDPYLPTSRVRSEIRKTDLTSLLEESDVVTLHLPLTQETKRLISEKQLRSMKRTAILINASRGGIVDESALHKALNEGWIGGAGIDVLENEPVEEHPLFELDGVLLTPHMASWTTEAFRRMAQETCGNILKVMNGKLPHSIVNPEVLEKRRP